MLIFSSENGDPMLLDSVTGLWIMHSKVEVFLASSAINVSFPAITGQNPEPYDELLGGLRMHKSEEPGHLIILDNRWLELSASRIKLQNFAKQLLALKDGGHNHWHSRPLSLIIEADDWRARR